MVSSVFIIIEKRNKEFIITIYLELLERQINEICYCVSKQTCYLNQYNVIILWLFDNFC